MSNEFEERARASKAFALVDAIDLQVRAVGLDPYSDAADIARMLTSWPAWVWNTLALSCGQRPPSETTQRLVVARVLSRAERVEQDGAS